MGISIQRNQTGEACLTINGRAVRGKNTVGLYGEPEIDSISVWNSKISKRISVFSLTDIPAAIEKLSLYFPIDSTLISDFEFKRVSDDWEVWVELRLDGENWKNRWTIREYCEAVISAATAEGRDLRYDDDFYGNDFRVQVCTTKDALIEQVIKEAVVEWERLHALTVRELEHAVVVEFDFPDEIRVSCEQYLLYFGQFLRDLGVETETTISRHDGRTILSASPLNKRDALEKIRQALEVYLQLSESPPRNDLNVPISAHQLIANIHHLQSQLSLARATIQAQDAAIIAQKTILDYRETPAKGLIEDSNQSPKHRQSSESILGGIITLGKTEPKYGLSVSWAELFRRLRQYFGKPD